MHKDTRILVTGAGGMVGSNIVPLLKESSYTQLITPSSEDIDLRDGEATRALFEKEQPEVVLHLAARVGGIKANIADPAGFLSDNLAIGLNVIGNAQRYGVKKLINLGSSCIYPRDCAQPMKEEYLLTGALEPTNEGYALGKIAALKLCQYLHQQTHCNFFTLIPPNLYGTHERMDPEHSHVIAGLVLKFHNAKAEGSPTVTLWGTGSARREFIFVEDLARAILFFMENVDADAVEGNFLNIGSCTDVSIRELAELVVGITGFQGTVEWDTMQPDGMPRKLMDSTRAERFEWRPQTSLEDGIRKMIATSFPDHP